MQPVEPRALAEPDGVRLVNPLEIADWDAQLANIPGATFFHSAAWARILAGSYGYRPGYFVQFQAGRIHAVLPIFEVDSWLTGRRGVSLPFTDECNPLCPDAGSFHKLFQHAQTYAHGRNWRYLECRGGGEWFGKFPPSTSFFSHRLNLQNDEATLFAQLDEATRRAIRKAERSNLTIEFSQSMEATQAFYGLLCLTRQRHGVPPQPFSFFANIYAHMLAQNKGWIVLARHEQVPVAGAVFFQFGNTATYKFGGSNESFQHLRANNLVMWQAIQHFARENFASLDFGRTSLNNDGLRRFKLGWGGVESPLNYVRYDFRRASYVAVPDAASGWLTNFFRFLPNAVSKWVGAMLYPHLG